MSKIIVNNSFSWAGGMGGPCYTVMIPNAIRPNTGVCDYNSPVNVIGAFVCHELRHGRPVTIHEIEFTGDPLKGLDAQQIGPRPLRARALESRETAAGLYLELYHGRNDPDVDMEDWGFEGPVLGPLKFIHFTYHSHYRVELLNGEATDPISYYDDMIFYDGKWYGDWSIVPADMAQQTLKKRLAKFDPGKAEAPAKEAQHAQAQS
jgi:hypothetical protein